MNPNPNTIHYNFPKVSGSSGSGYVDFGDNEHLCFEENDFTFEAWFYYPDNLASSSYALISNMDYSSSYYHSGFAAWINTGNDKLVFALADGSGIWGNGVGRAFVSIPSANKWHHVVLTVDGRDASDWKVYIDGAAQSVTADLDNLTDGDISSGTLETLKIGSRKDGHPNNDMYFEGSIRDVRLYNRVLLSSEVTQLYNNGCTPDLNLSGLVFYAPLNEGTGSESYDNTIYGATGSFEGTGLDWGRDLGKVECVDGNKVCFGDGEYRKAQYARGFQGQEKDDEWAGTGNVYAFKYRMHDSRTGRFYSVDPLFREYAYNSPYAFAENKLGLGVEFEGLELQKLNSSMYNYTYVASFPKPNGQTDIVYYTKIIEENVPPGFVPKPNLVVGVNGKNNYNSNPIYKKGKNIEQPGEPPEPDFPEKKPLSNASKKADGIVLLLDTYKGLKNFLYNLTAGLPEVSDRYSYYNAFKITDKYRDIKFLDNFQEFKGGQGFADLVNYVNDGTLPDRKDVTTEYLNDLQYVGNAIFEQEGIENRREANDDEPQQGSF